MLQKLLDAIIDVGLPLLVKFLVALIPKLSALINIPFVGWIFQWMINSLAGKVVDWMNIIINRRGLQNEKANELNAAQAASAALDNATKEDHDAKLKAWQDAMLNFNSIG
jgi:hypothetical protein